MERSCAHTQSYLLWVLLFSFFPGSGFRDKILKFHENLEYTDVEKPALIRAGFSITKNASLTIISFLWITINSKNQ